MRMFRGHGQENRVQSTWKEVLHTDDSGKEMRNEQVPVLQAEEKVSRAAPDGVVKHQKSFINSRVLTGK